MNWLTRELVVQIGKLGIVFAILVAVIIGLWGLFREERIDCKDEIAKMWQMMDELKKENKDLNEQMKQILLNRPIIQAKNDNYYEQGEINSTNTGTIEINQKRSRNNRRNRRSSPISDANRLAMVGGFDRYRNFRTNFWKEGT